MEEIEASRECREKEPDVEAEVEPRGEFGTGGVMLRGWVSMVGVTDESKEVCSGGGDSGFE